MMHTILVTIMKFVELVLCSVHNLPRSRSLLSLSDSTDSKTASAPLHENLIKKKASLNTLVISSMGFRDDYCK